MKKLLFLAVAGLVLSASAVPQKILQLTVADRQALISQAAKLGEMVNFPMAGMMAMGGLAANPVAEAFGAMRDGEPALVNVIADPDLLSADAVDQEALEKFVASMRVAGLYPASIAKSGYAAKHPDFKEEDGVFKVPSLDLYAAYSADGKWVALSALPENVKPMLKEIGTKRLTQGEAVRLDVTEGGFKAGLGGFALLTGLVEKDGDEATLRQVARYCELLEQMKAFSIALRVSDKGIDILLDQTFKAGSMLARVNAKTLTRSVLPAACDPNAFCAFAAAATGSDKVLAELVGVLKESGLSFDFLTVRQAGEQDQAMTIDVRQLVKMLADKADLLEKLNADEAFEKKLEQIAATDPMTYDGPERGITIALKGQTFKTAPAARFAAAMPEVKGRKLSTAFVCSLYAALRQAAKDALPALPEGERAAIEDFLSKVPETEGGAIAMAVWPEGSEKVSGFLRVSAPEVKAFASVVMSALGGGMMVTDLPDDED